MRWSFRSRRAFMFMTLGLSSLVSIGFFVVNSINQRAIVDSYLISNLILAWLPFITVNWLIMILPRYPWISWRIMLLTVVWISLLPNSFYLVSDLTHLNESTNNILYTSAMFESFILNGLMLGYISVYLIHQQLRQRLSRTWVNILLGLTFFVCSFAIYLGRDLRWSSWDLLTNPAAILFDISNIFVNPSAHIQAFTTTAMFFVLISSIYVVLWRLARLSAARNR